MEWISIEDRLPNEEDYYLVVWDYDEVEEVGEAFYSEKWYFPYYSNEKDVTEPKVTHWMPLPKPPKNSPHA